MERINEKIHWRGPASQPPLTEITTEPELHKPDKGTADLDQPARPQEMTMTVMRVINTEI